jgi:hypothetical protein
MANTSNTLYPPIVSTFMPAFVKDTPAVIYYSISNFNSASSIKYIHYTLRSQKTNLNCLNVASGIWIEEFDKSAAYDPETGMYKLVIDPNVVFAENLNNKNNSSNESTEDTNNTTDTTNGGTETDGTTNGGTETDGTTEDNSIVEDSENTSTQTDLSFNNNEYYQVQIRFDCNNESDNAPDLINIAKNDNYFLSNTKYFSEWSSVCLIRPIAKPHIVFTRIDNEALHNANILSKVVQPIVGTFYFGDNSTGSSTETETIESYRIYLLDPNTGEELITTNTIYTSGNVNPNAINTSIDLTSPSLVGNYTLVVDYTTKNQYSGTETRDIIINDYADTDNYDWVSGVVLSTEYDSEAAMISVYVDYSAVPIPSGGIIHVRRTSSKSSFKEWESIGDYISTSDFKKTIYDYAIESHVWYKYSVYFESQSGSISKPKNSQVLYPIYEDCLFYRQNRQLNLKYNYKISSFKSVVNRAKIDTLGGKYPKFAENAAMNYKQFSISATITGMLDLDGTFYDREKYFKSIDGTEEYYAEYLKSNESDSSSFGYKMITGSSDSSYDIYVNKNTYVHNDTFWERIFRDEVIDWLNDGEVKLYRSPSEGLMAVMLTDISITPNATIGRRIWDLSATVYEVADATSLSDLSTLGIVNIPSASLVTLNSSTDNGDEDKDNSDDDSSSAYEDNNVSIPFQLYNISSGTNTQIDIVSEIMKDIKRRGVGVRRNNSIDESSAYYIKDVKLYFTSKPNYYSQDEKDGNSLNKVEEKLKINQTSMYYNNNYLFGYNTLMFDSASSEKGQYVFINHRGYYQFPSDISIYKLWINSGDIVTVEGTFNYVRTGYQEGIGDAFATSTDYIAGQYSGVFEPNDQNISILIKKKYAYTYISNHILYTRAIRNWGGLIFDVNPYSVFDIRHTGELDFYTGSRAIIGETGILNLSKEYNIQEIIYRGRLVFETSSSNLKFINNKQFIMSNDNTNYNTVNSIISPTRNTVYTVKNQYYIYFNNSWYSFTYNKDEKTGIVAVPGEGTISYTGYVLETESDYDNGEESTSEVIKVESKE